MYFSIDFFYKDPLSTDSFVTKRNTWDDWKLLPMGKPIIATPEFESQLVTIPGSNGFVNISEILTGYPTYKSRKGSIEFMVLNQYNTPDAIKWTELYNAISKFLHGREVMCVLEDDPTYYYSGVFTLEPPESGSYNTTITLNYELQPYKLRRWLTDEDWLWDPFDFVDGVVPNISNFVWNTSAEIDTINLTGLCGDMPVVPTFKISYWTTRGDNPHCDCKLTQINRYGETIETVTTIVPPDNITNNEFEYTDPKFVIFGDTVAIKLAPSNCSFETNISFREGKI